MVELHSNSALRGTTGATDGIPPTQDEVNETLEIIPGLMVGLTPKAWASRIDPSWTKGPPKFYALSGNVAKSRALS